MDVDVHVDVDVDVDVDADVDDPKLLTLAHDRLDAYQGAVEFRALAVGILKALSGRSSVRMKPK